MRLQSACTIVLVALDRRQGALASEEFNAAVHEPAHASSYYNFALNALDDTAFVPSNANDGVPDATSWWSAGDEATETVYWQVNVSTLALPLSRIVVRWHGYLSPRSYRIRVSWNGRDFTSLLAVSNLTNAYDRVDSYTNGLSELSSTINYVRVVMGDPNVCSDRYSCLDDGVNATRSETNERVVYGLREVEVWVKGRKNGALSIVGKPPLGIGLVALVLLFVS